MVATFSRMLRSIKEHHIAMLGGAQADMIF